jgi:glycosyltransferase involved in cell wall biosynthesis
MIKNQKIVWWETQLTQHQSYTLEELSQKINISVIVVKDENKIRLKQGWKLKTKLDSYKLPNWNYYTLIKKILKNKNKIHFFAGPFENRKLILASLILIMLKSKVYFFSEPYSPIKFDYLNNGNKISNYMKYKFRPFLYKIYGKIYLNNINGILTVSELAIKQFKEIGAKNKQIYPFGYFVPKLNFKKNVNENRKKLKIVFVGSLIYRKGIDYLCKVVKKLNSKNFVIQLDVYGPGNTAILGKKTKGLNYCGVIPFGQSQQVISDYDLFVFPSRFDGWGVVVNESILAGVPVLCSDSVGAKCIIEKFNCGVIFSLNKKNDLENKLKNLANNQFKLKEMSKNISLAQKFLSPKYAATYIFDVLNNNKPISPWYKKNKIYEE